MAVVQHWMMLPRLILGIVGNVISFGLFLSPMPTIYRFFEKKSTEEFHSTNYIAGLLNCSLWVMYGALHPDSTLVWTINAVGLVCYFVYFVIFVIFATKRMKLISAGGLILDIIIVVVIYIPIRILVPGDLVKQSEIIGKICIVFNIILYASPLSVLAKVFKTKSVEYLPFWVSLAGFLNGTVWTIYGLLPVDVNLLVGNGLGAILSVFQLILHLVWGHPVDDFLFPFKFVLGHRQPKKGDQFDDKDEKAVQMQPV